MNRLAKIDSPIEPPTWRTKLLTPAAPASSWRGMFDSAAVVSGTNRNAKPTPVIASGQNRSLLEVDRLISACSQQPSAVSTRPSATSHDGRIWLYSRPTNGDA